MAAISSSLMLLRSGDHVVATRGLYGGTFRVLGTVFEGLGLSTTFADTCDPQAVAQAFRPNTRALCLETPSNPLMEICDLRALSTLAHDRGAIVMVDNTFMSPYLQRPLTLGADVVVHSATKFLGGHSDLIAGLAVVRDAALAKRLKHIQNAVGAIPGPQDAWLLVRSMKTLEVRLERSQQSAGEIARWLVDRPEVAEVYYPGLTGHPGGEVHRRQADGPGAVLSFRLRDAFSVRRLLSGLQYWTLAVSLGGVESIITQPSRMTHASYPPELREQLGITDNLVRLSVGLEDAEDLTADLEAAFARARNPESSL
jgi:cystathionine beta-lyase